MKSQSDRLLRHPATYCWPPFLAIAPQIIGGVLGATRPEVFRHNHGYFEIAIAVGFIAAIGYTFTLWKNRADRRYRVPIFLNMGFILLAVAGGLWSWFMDFFK